jgi:hypothetical protein
VAESASPHKLYLKEQDLVFVDLSLGVRTAEDNWKVLVSLFSGGWRHMYANAACGTGSEAMRLSLCGSSKANRSSAVSPLTCTEKRNPVATNSSRQSPAIVPQPCSFAPNRPLFQALDVVRDGLDLIVCQARHRFLVRHFPGIVPLAKQQHNVILAQFGGFQ